MKYSLVSFCLVALMAIGGAANAAVLTFTNAGSITIPGSGTSGTASPYPSVINVSGLTNVTDVDIRLNGLSHTYSNDLEIRVVGPTGAAVWLMRDQGGGDNWTNDNVTFSNGGGGLNPGSSGTYAPLQSLAAFNGLDPSGVWSLFIFDDAGADVGSVSGGWSITITGDEVSAVPLPAALPLLVAGLGGLGFIGRRKKKAA